MKNPRIIGLIITAFLITTAFAGCGSNNASNSSNSNTNSDANSSQSVPPISTGNTNGNINNSGLAALQNGWIYYDSGAGMYKIKTDGTGAAKLNDDTCWWINAFGDWIYFANGSDGYKLYKIKTDGTSKTKVSDETMYAIHVIGDWIYYTDYSDSVDNSGKIYKMKTDGTSKTLISDTISYYINVTGNWVYYGTGSELFKIKTDGTGKTKLTEDTSYYNVVGDINVSGEWIYYTEYSEYSGKLQKIKTDGTGKTLVNSGMSRDVNLVGDWFYYSNADDSTRLYKMKTDGSSKTKLNSDASGFPNIVGDWIYYYDEATGQYCKMKTDGSGGTVITPKSDTSILPDSSTRYLADNEVSSLSKDQLAIARNEIFARHGYVFANQWYNDYFNSKSWYVPNPNFKGTFEELNSYEVYNVQLIQKYEGNSAAGSYILPDSSTRYMADNEVSSLSKDQLAIARNEIFARHGYVFANQWYNDYFRSMSWYVPNPSFSGNFEELNAYEQYNALLIQKYETNTATSSYILPDSSTRYLADSEVSSLTKEQLALARNEIFARHGYVFNNQTYKDYFSSKSWYVPDPSFSGSLDDLNAYEKYNVQLIQKYE